MILNIGNLIKRSPALRHLINDKSYAKVSSIMVNLQMLG